MRVRSHLLQALASVCLLFTVNPALSAATWTEINFPGAMSTGISDINNNDDMAGIYVDPGTFTIHGFALTAGAFSTVDPPGSVFTQALALNDNGDIVGNYSIDNAGSNQGFLLQGGTYTTIDFPGAARTFCTGINNAGEIVGFYVDGTGHEHGFELTGTTFTSIDIAPPQSTELTGINDNGDIVGNIYTNGPLLNPTGFLLSGGVTTFLHSPGSHTRLQITGINNLRRIVGTVTDKTRFQTTFRGWSYSNGTYLILGDPNIPPTDGVELSGINDAGKMVGSYIDSASNDHGLLRTPN